MRVPLVDLVTFSNCPKLLTFGYFPSPPKSKDVDIIRSVIYTAYNKRSEHRGRPMEWKSLLWHIDKQVFKNVDVSDAQSFQFARERAERIINFIARWYELYKVDTRDVFANVPMEYECGDIVITDRMPIIALGDTTYVTFIGQEDRDLYRDLYMRCCMLMIMEVLELPTAALKYLQMGKEGGTKEEVLQIGGFQNRNIKRYLFQLARGVANKVNYPNYGEHCKSCQYRKDCVL